MRVISGRFAGKSLKAPSDQRIHPMSEKARAAIFSVLGDVSQLTAADLYAGSGAIGLESVSRGVSHIVFVDSLKSSILSIEDNINSLGLDKDTYQVIQKPVSSWSRQELRRFDLIFADPPYAESPLDVLDDLRDRLLPGGLIVLSWPGKLDLPEVDGLSLIRSKRYGDAQIAYFRKTDLTSR